MDDRLRAHLIGLFAMGHASAWKYSVWAGDPSEVEWVDDPEDPFAAEWPVAVIQLGEPESEFDSDTELDPAGWFGFALGLN